MSSKASLVEVRAHESIADFDPRGGDGVRGVMVLVHPERELICPERRAPARNEPEADEHREHSHPRRRGALAPVLEARREERRDTHQRQVKEAIGDTGDHRNRREVHRQAEPDRDQSESRCVGGSQATSHRGAEKSCDHEPEQPDQDQAAEGDEAQIGIADGAAQRAGLPRIHERERVAPQRFEHRLGSTEDAEIEALDAETEQAEPERGVDADDRDYRNQPAEPCR